MTWDPTKVDHTLQAVVLARKAVTDTNTYSGHFECPTGCGGTVRWAADRGNKHTRGACTNSFLDKCHVAWIQ